MKLFCLTVFVCLASSYAGSPTKDEDSQRAALANKAKLIEKLSTVKTSDGISREEAVVIARNFAARYILCGGFRDVTEEDGFWVVHNAVGYWGKPDSSTKNAKKDGIITTKLNDVGPWSFAALNAPIYPYHIWD